MAPEVALQVGDGEGHETREENCIEICGFHDTLRQLPQVPLFTRKCTHICMAREVALEVRRGGRVTKRTKELTSDVLIFATR